MKQLTCFLVFVFLTLSGSTYATNLSISSTNGNIGEQVTLAITVEDFTDIISIQGTIEFTPEVCKFVGLSGFAFNDMSSANFGLQLINQGQLTYSWNDSDLSGENLEDEAVLFVIVFELTGNPGDFSLIEFQSSPVMLEIVNSDFDIVPATYNSGIVQITEFSEIPLTLTFNSSEGVLGDVVTISLTAENFSELISLQGSIQFSMDIINFKGVTCTNESVFSTDDFGLENSNNGTIIFSWNDETIEGQTYYDDMPLFELTFEIIGNPGEQSTVALSDTPLLLECINSDFEQVEIHSNNGTISVDQQTSDYVQLTLGNTVGDIGHTINVPLTVSNFQNIVSMQASIVFDHELLDFISVNQLGLEEFSESNFGLNDADNGQIVFSWNDASLTGISLSDETILCNFQFMIISNQQNETIIEIADAPTTIEFVNSDFSVTNVSITNGTVQIIENQPPAISEIPAQSIEQNESFTDINLSDYIQDDYSEDEDIIWSFSGNTNLLIEINNQLASITAIDENWTGNETITFTATDESGLFAEVDVQFNISYITGINLLKENIEIAYSAHQKHIIINNLTKKSTIEILTISGQKVVEYKNITSKNISFPFCLTGVFIVRIFDGNKYYSHKLLIPSY